jgi:pyruvate, orthophosphate dikinase
MNDAVVNLLAESTGRHRHFALDTYRRFLRDYGIIVKKVSSDRYREIQERAFKHQGVETESKLSTESLIHIVEEYKHLADIPDDPYEQLKEAIEAIFQSWQDER